MNLAERLLAHARERPDAPALLDTRRGTDRTTTFAQLADQAARGAAHLAGKGIGPGDRVLVLVPMSAALYATILAVVWRGAVVVLPDLSADRRVLDAALARLGCKGFVGVPRAHLLRLLSRQARRIPVALRPGPSWQRHEPAPMAQVAPHAPAVVTFTSGTTGRPKILLRSHAFLLTQEAAIRRLLDSGPGDVELTTLPMFVLANLARGAASLLPDVDLRRPADADAARLLTQAERRGATGLAGSPALVERVAEEGLRAGRALPALRTVHTGGGPVHPDLLDLVARWAPLAHAAAVYGSSEAEPIAELPAETLTDADRAAVAAGAGLPAGRLVEGLQLRFLEGREIAVAGPHVLPGYMDGEGDAETKLRLDGAIWHRTGDGGRLDAHGRLWLLGRCSAAIRDARGELWPLAVEAAARSAGARRTALASVEGRRVLAVEGEPPAGLAAALAWAELDEIRPVARIPMDRRHNAKVDHAALLRLLAGGPRRG